MHQFKIKNKFIGRAVTIIRKVSVFVKFYEIFEKIKFFSWEI